MDKAIEAAFVEAFVQKRKRERAMYALSKPQLRWEFIDDITQNFYDPRYAERFPRPLATYHPLYELLRSHAAPKACYVMGGGHWTG